jgi:hypothetical protein
LRTIGLAALVAAGLTVTLAGAASAGTPVAGPPGEGVIITCRDGKPVERRATDGDRERIEKLRKRDGESPDGKRRVIIDGERGEDHRSPEEICASRR